MERMRSGEQLQLNPPELTSCPRSPKVAPFHSLDCCPALGAHAGVALPTRKRERRRSQLQHGGSKTATDGPRYSHDPVGGGSIESDDGIMGLRHDAADAAGEVSAKAGEGLTEVAALSVLTLTDRSARSEATPTTSVFESLAKPQFVMLKSHCDEKKKTTARAASEKALMIMTP